MSTTRRSRRGQEEDPEAEEAQTEQTEKETTEELEDKDEELEEKEMTEEEEEEEEDKTEDKEEETAEEEKKEEAAEEDKEQEAGKEQEAVDEEADKEEEEEVKKEPEGEEGDDDKMDTDKDKENGEEAAAEEEKKKITRKRKADAVPEDLFIEPPPTPLDPEILKQQELIDGTPRTTELEHALYESLQRKESQVERLSGEVTKLKAFISKRKQTYKRKRKDEGAPTRALSAYNIFVQDRFSRLAKENEHALKSSDSDAQLKRVPPASLVASTGNQWKELSAEDKVVYEERAREDRKRYEEQMAKYQPPDKQANRKRNKTGYNMFFSAHVLRLKQSEAGVPSERGSVARLVGNAWKQLTAEEKQYYEREADKMNGMNPIDKEEEEEEGDDKRPAMPEYPANYPPQHGEMHMHAGMPPPMHGHPQHPGQHDPRQHGYHYPPNYPYAQPPYHGYHEQAAGGGAQGQHRHYQGRQHGAHYQYPPPPHATYDQRGMGM